MGKLPLSIRYSISYCIAVLALFCSPLWGNVRHRLHIAANRLLWLLPSENSLQLLVYLKILFLFISSSIFARVIYINFIFCSDGRPSLWSLAPLCMVLPEVTKSSLKQLPAGIKCWSNYSLHVNDALLLPVCELKSSDLSGFNHVIMSSGLLTNNTTKSPMIFNAHSILAQWKYYFSINYYRLITISILLSKSLLQTSREWYGSICRI